MLPDFQSEEIERWLAKQAAKERRDRRRAAYRKDRHRLQWLWKRLIREWYDVHDLRTFEEFESWISIQHPEITTMQLRDMYPDMQAEQDARKETRRQTRRVVRDMLRHGEDPGEFDIPLPWFD